jgi:tetratricopeptide (TPR) repeat protein
MRTAAIIRAAALITMFLLAACSEPVRAQNPVLATDIATAEAALKRGDRETAIRTATRVVDGFQKLPQPTSGDHVLAGRAYVILGLGDASAVRRALAEFDAARAADPTNTEAELRAGELFLDKYNAPDARSSFESVLKIEPKNARALLGLARVMDFEGKGDALAAARMSVAANPRYTDALVMVARMHLEAEQYDSAQAMARRALATDSTSVPAWAVLGANAWVTGDSATFRSARAAATALQPKPAEFLTELAEAAVRQRRYVDAIGLARRAGHERIACRPDRGRPERARSRLQARSVQPVAQEHARPAGQDEVVHHDRAWPLPARRAAGRGGAAGAVRAAVAGIGVRRARGALRLQAAHTGAAGVLPAARRFLRAHRRSRRTGCAGRELRQPAGDGHAIGA